MFRQPIIAIVALTVWAFAPAWLAAVEPPATVERDLENRIVRLMAQLGDQEFAARERATEQLIRIGLPAAAALEDGLRQPDREVRYRAERILVIVREVDFRTRLSAFLTDPDKSNGHGLPGWDSYQQRVGSDSEARELFAELQKAEPDVMRALEKDPKDASQVVLTRCHELAMGMRNRTERREPTLGTIAALLFAAGMDDVTLDQMAAGYLHQFCYQNVFRNAVQSGPQSRLLRQLLAGWIRRNDDATAYQGMMLAMLYDLKEGLEPAVRTLSGPNVAPQHVRLYAMLTIAKLGGEEQIELLERQLDDKTVYGGKHKVNNVEYQTQMRDVALASLWYLVKEDPKKHGFEIIQPHPQYVFNSNMAGFASDQARGKAQTHWREFREAMKKPSREGKNGQADK